MVLYIGQLKIRVKDLKDLPTNILWFLILYLMLTSYCAHTSRANILSCPTILL